MKVAGLATDVVFLRGRRAEQDRLLGKHVSSTLWSSLKWPAVGVEGAFRAVMMDSTNRLRIAIDGNTFDVDLTTAVTSVVKVMLRPYNGLLAQMVEDGRLNPEETDQLRRRIHGQGDRLGELVREGLVRPD